ncbi:hypothetical protein KL86SPO_50096 [uncultured Sporomusa sp.]|uniref:Uncharacterized protein n=1 Tax=uncultured Sporomusa sp. TaxID=307249 RepID=A0A212LXM9_9FIRM|nr:hypothetical protein [uncultured Sporomusa sp.]SCM82325.1 hypothetical protein KL86SPO_50096 [uncultured Sporomusa sp.]
MIQILNQLGFTYCYHITPLHYLPSIINEQTLYSKDKLRRKGMGVVPRPSSCNIDVTLGFSNYVHTFPIRNIHRSSINQAQIKEIPILKNKLEKGFPHVCLRIPISIFTNPIICWWNAAKGHPNGNCGNWSAQRIKQEWLNHMNNDISLKRAKGFFNPPIIIPTVNSPAQLTSLIDSVGVNTFKNRTFELLEPDSLSLQTITIESFCVRDYDLIQNKLLTNTTATNIFNLTLIDPSINGYEYNMEAPYWTHIDTYFTTRNWSIIPNIPFD